MIKRSYKTVTVTPVEGGYGLLLDDKPLKTPVRHRLVVPSEKLASAITLEWQEQGKTIQPQSMPLTQLATTAMDLLRQHRAQIIKQLMAYVETDLVCCRVAEPLELAQLQAKHWDPALEWLKKHHGIAWNTTVGLAAVTQPEGAVQALAHILEEFNDWQLIGLQTAAHASTSLVLALALFEGAFTADEVFAAAELEGTYHMSVWGDDPALKAKRESVHAEIAATARWFELIKAG